MILETHRESLKHLEPMQVQWMNCAKCDTQRKNVRMRAYGEVLSVQYPFPTCEKNHALLSCGASQRGF